MKLRRFTLVAGAFIFLHTTAPAAPITGEALIRASAAALEYTGGGQVTETEVGDEEGYYEVEVTLAGGRQVDVHLDEQFNVIGDEADNESDEDPDDDADADDGDADDGDDD